MEPVTLKISGRAMSALVASQEKLAQAQQHAEFVGQTIADAYDIDGTIVGMNPETCEITYMPTAE